jgi:hypothetical protein
MDPRVGPAAAEVDDIVALFPGAAVLFIIRPKRDGTHELIGECYCHGIMYGEAMENETEWEKSLQEMALR